MSKNEKFFLKWPISWSSADQIGQIQDKLLTIYKAVMGIKLTTKPAWVYFRSRWLMSMTSWRYFRYNGYFRFGESHLIMPNRGINRLEMMPGIRISDQNQLSITSKLRNNPIEKFKKIVWELFYKKILETSGHILTIFLSRKSFKRFKIVKNELIVQFPVDWYLYWACFDDFRQTGSDSWNFQNAITFFPKPTKARSFDHFTQKWLLYHNRYV